MSRPSRDSVMVALYDHLVAALVIGFTANTQSGQVTLSNPSSISNLYLGMPVFGAGIPRGAVIASLSPLQLSIAATATANSVSLTSGFQTTGRRLDFSEKLPQPALFVLEGDDHIAYEGLNEFLTMGAEIYVTSQAGENPDYPPGAALNNMLDAVRSALSPDEPQGLRFTLNGLVAWCRMEGKVEKDRGDLGNLAIAAAEVSIIVP